MKESENKGNGVTKNWLIGILVAIVAGLLAVSVRSHLETDQRQSEHIETIEQKLPVILTKLEVIEKIVNEIKTETKHEKTLKRP